ncbi:MAG: hypothetical protein GTN35_03780 [Nitrososphaeria archaeon]|nr:hypothetical protein [Nitrosopumilaceae archaeon]NIP10139.1 hypothetical protein [Nitrosopumilaceae archaeon]NIP91503.1 hypothetical protein [Nitrososphaeria archaeon]NIS95338.1 hypothetical protein [Nitrosopumilaceae archaeon]
MSDEFLKVATKEINDELTGISKILGSCNSDEDVFKNSAEIERHMHKIKGLAPMMGKENVGSLAKSLDVILKKIAAGQKVDGFFGPLLTSVSEMKIAMEKSHDLSQAQKEISNISSTIAD